jgi:hypothetical protein
VAAPDESILSRGVGMVCGMSLRRPLVRLKYGACMERASARLTLQRARSSGGRIKHAYSCFIALEGLHDPARSLARDAQSWKSTIKQPPLISVNNSSLWYVHREGRWIDYDIEHDRTKGAFLEYEAGALIAS